MSPPKVGNSEAEAVNFEFLGVVSVEAIRELLIGSRDFEEAVARLRSKSKPQRHTCPKGPVAWLYRRYGKGRPTCVKVARFESWKHPSPAIQLSFERSRRPLQGADMTRAVAKALYSIAKKGNRQLTEVQINNVTASALKPFLDKGKWHIEPLFLESAFVQEENRYAVEITDGWVARLLRWVEDEYWQGVKRSARVHDPACDQRRNRRFKEKARQFGVGGPDSFFTKIKPRDYWEIVSRWDDWGREGKRMKDVQTTLEAEGVEYGQSGLSRLCHTTLKLGRLVDIAKNARQHSQEM